MFATTAVSHSPVFEDAIGEVVRKVQASLKQAPPDLAVLFVSPQHAPCYFKAVSTLKGYLKDTVVTGCSARTTLNAEGAELPTVELTVLSLPNVTVSEFEFQNGSLPSADGSPKDWRRYIKPLQKLPDVMLIFADPFSINTQEVLDGLDFAFPKAVKTGALASGDAANPNHVVFSGGRTLKGGLAGVALSGDVQLESEVINYCQPIGDPLVVTSVEDNRITGFNGDKPAAVLERIFGKAEPEERKAMNASLTLGLASQQDDTFKIRNIRLVDTWSGALVIGDAVDAGSIAQFHINRPAMSDYSSLHGRAKGNKPAWALAFACISQGLDATQKALADACKGLNMGGLLCNGQIAWANGKSQLLGYTATVALLSPRIKPDGRVVGAKTARRSRSVSS